MDEIKQQEYYKKRILEAVTAMTSEKYLKLVFYFVKACYREEKEKRLNVPFSFLVARNESIEKLAKNFFPVCAHVIIINYNFLKLFIVCT